MQKTAVAENVRLRRVRLSTGVTLEVAETGPAAGDAVLFLHGLTDSWFSFSRVMGSLPAALRAIVPSQRGHGDSERPSCCYRVADSAADAVALLDALGIERAHVVGHSMGSFVAQRVAVEHPERVNRLVLVGSGTTVRLPAVIAFSEELQTLPDPVAAEFARGFQESTIFKPVPHEFLDLVVRESLKVPARVWRDALAGLLADDARHPLERIQARTLIVWGDKDAFWPRAEQDGLVRAIRGARLIVYPNIGHAPHWEQPDHFVTDLRNFLEGGATRARTRR
jgi:pimeloyl-ACP methyl ester carboxylesterase